MFVDVRYMSINFSFCRLSLYCDDLLINFCIFVILPFLLDIFVRWFCNIFVFLRNFSIRLFCNHFLYSLDIFITEVDSFVINLYRMRLFLNTFLALRFVVFIRYLYNWRRQFWNKFFSLKRFCIVFVQFPQNRLSKLCHITVANFERQWH